MTVVRIQVPVARLTGSIYKNLQNCVITNNVLPHGAVKTLVEGSGGNGVIVRDNSGSLLVA
jgi:hypothetical protein